MRNNAETAPGDRTYNKLMQMLDNAGIPVEDVILTHATSAMKAAERLQPNVIVSMGGEAFDACYANEEQTNLGSLRGEWVKSIFGPKLVPTFHPGFVYKNWNTQETIEYDLRKAYRRRLTPKMPLLLGKSYSVITDIDEAKRLAEYLKAAPYLAFDIETEGFDLFTDDEIMCIQFSTQTGEGFVLPLRGEWQRHKKDLYSDWQLANGFWKWTEDQRKVLSSTDDGIKLMKPAFPAGSVVCQTPAYHENKKLMGHMCRGFLTNVLGGEMTTYDGPGRMHGKEVPMDYLWMRNIIEDILTSRAVKVAHNGKFDVHGCQYQLGIITRRFLFDTMLAYHQFHEVGPHRLEFVRPRYSDVPYYEGWKKEYLGKSKKTSFATIPNETLWEYGGADADLERRLVEPLIAEIELDNPENGLWLFNNIDMPFNRALCQIETNGMLIDPERFTVLSGVYATAIKELAAKIEAKCAERGVSALPEGYTNSNTLRPWLYDTGYEVVDKEEKWYVHRPCKKQGCDDCVDGKYLAKPAVTHSMVGMGFPDWMVEKTDGDEEKTDKKAFTRLKQWCNEVVMYTSVTLKNGKLIRKPTSKKLKKAEIEQRQWMRDILLLVTHYKQAVQAKTLFLDGKDADNPEYVGEHIDGAKAMLQHIKWDGRVHAEIKQLTKTARTSTSKPNLANIANEEEYFKGFGIRTMFRAPEGYDFLEADYSSQEIRVLAYLAKETGLMHALMTCACGENFEPTEEDPKRPWLYKPHRALTGHKAPDIHQSTASKVFNKSYDDVTDTERTFAKRVTFGLNYGQSVSGLSDVLGIPYDDASKLIDEYMAAFPRIRLFQKRMKRTVWRGDKILNAYGRYRHNYGVREMREFLFGYEYEKVLTAMERQSGNFPIQSTPADIMGNVAVALADVWGVENEDWQDVESLVIAHELMGGQHPALMLRDMGVRVVNLVYDSVEMEVPKANTDEVAQIVETVMEQIPYSQLGWYLPIDLTVGEYWGQAKVEKGAEKKRTADWGDVADEQDSNKHDNI